MRVQQLSVNGHAAGGHRPGKVFDKLFAGHIPARFQFHDVVEPGAQVLRVGLSSRSFSVEPLANMGKDAIRNLVDVVLSEVAEGLCGMQPRLELACQAGALGDIAHGIVDRERLLDPLGVVRHELVPHLLHRNLDTPARQFRLYCAEQGCRLAHGVRRQVAWQRDGRRLDRPWLVAGRGRVRASAAESVITGDQRVGSAFIGHPAFDVPEAEFSVYGDVPVECARQLLAVQPRIALDQALAETELVERGEPLATLVKLVPKPPLQPSPARHVSSQVIEAFVQGPMSRLGRQFDRPGLRAEVVDRQFVEPLFHRIQRAEDLDSLLRSQRTVDLRCAQSVRSEQIERWNTLDAAEFGHDSVELRAALSEVRLHHSAVQVGESAV
ncbi:hypothetical protein GCM10009565_52020 [Amycolatopsis albidoflavus]